MKKNYSLKTPPHAATINAWDFLFLKNKTSLVFALLFTFLGFSDVFGQVANYTFSESAGTYSSAAGTTVHASGWDDAVSANTIPLGFTFVFNGTNYTTCSIATNGFLTFGGTVAGTTEFTPISSGTGYAGAISAIGYDLISNASTITYTTTGTAPNRTFIAQWNNARRYSAGTINGDFNFQIRLNETTNIINIVYGACAPATNNNYNVQVGLRGVSNADFNNRSFASNAIWDNATTAGGANNATCRTINTAYPTTGRTFTWTPPTPPTITSFTPSSACASSSQTVVITGTNFTGATAVTIGSTAAASYVVNSATQITATIGTGTTGTIQVTTPGGSATSAATFTVNPLPANPGNPTSNSPQCNPPGVTLTRTGTPPAGVTWYWQTVAGGTSTANSGATFVATTGGTYYLRAQNNTTGCWSAGSGSVAITITPSLSAVAGTPAPTNAATGICYAGGSTLTDLTWNAVAGATSYDVYFGAGSLPGTAIANVATNSYTLGTLNANTTYYWQVVPRNACGATSGTPATWTFTTSNAPCVCVPTATSDDNTGITNVTFNTINNTTTGTAAYTNTGISTTVTGTNIYPLSVSVNTGGAYTVNVKAWIDWNNNGLFTDPGEEYNLGSATNGNPILSSLSPLNISIPNIVGSFKMRVRASYNTAPTPCGNQNYSEAEDYTIVVTAPPACTTPTAAPTALALSAGTPNGTAINGSFTAAAPAPQNYLVIVSTSNTAPAISNGTTYTTGGNAGAGYTVVDTDANTTFTASGLNPSTTYYFYIYSMNNNLCSGGPLYNATPLTGNLTTGATVPTYCNATTNTPGTRYIDDISFLGMLNGNIYNLNTGFTTTPAPGGYQDWTGLATKPRQAQGGGVNISFESNSRGTWKAWVDWNKDGDFTDAGELVYTSAGVAMITNTFGFIIPSGATPGDYRVRIRTYNAFGNYDPFGNGCDDPAYEYYGDGAGHFDSCTQFTSYSQFINAGCWGDNVTFTEYGEAEDYLFTVVEMCEANIVTVTDGEVCGPGTVNLSVTGTTGTISYRWYDAKSGGTLLNTNAGNWTTPLIGATTSYWVTAFNGSCESLVRTEVIAKVSPLPTISFTPSIPEVCGENNIISITASGDTELVYIIDEKFEGGGLGVFSNNHITSTAFDTKSAWQNKTSTLIPNGSSWYPAISSNFGANHFALVTSDIGTNGLLINNALQSASYSTNNFLNLTLSFRMYYSRYHPDGNLPASEYMQVEVSDNGGAWTGITANIITDQGYGTDFKLLSYNLNSYINKANIRIRIRYYAGDWYDGAAVDDVKLYGTRPLNTSFNWTSVLPVDAYSDAACTTSYTAGTPAVTVYIKPTLAQLELTTYSFTASATLNNGCSASSLVSIDNKSKVWKGGTSGDWSNANNWLPVGVPDPTSCVIIPPAPNSSLVGGASVNGFGKTLQVINGGNLRIDPTNTLTITDFVEVRGATSVFNIENSGSLIQVNNVANIGNITYKRTANIRQQDYVYWSSPVASFASSAISPGTSLGYQYKWLPTTVTGRLSDFGNWTYANETMVLGKGYIVRGPNAYTTTFAPYTASFFGVPNNGNISIPITRSGYNSGNYTYVNGSGSTITVTQDDDNWNLVGNPYPSAIDAKDFLTLNTNIAGFVNIWTHGTLPSNAIADPFYNDYAYNYTPLDYITYNLTGASTQNGFNGKIGAGQGFFVSMLHAAATPGTLVFNNSLRSNAHNNGQFFRTSAATVAAKDLERHRIWFDLVTPSGTSVRSLLGYVESATDDNDRLFDAFSNEKSTFNIFSYVNDEKMLIQGRKLPFDVNDKVNIGVSIPVDGLYKIAISSVDGLFLDPNQDIYLEDKLLNVIFNLRTAPYSFMGNKGTIKDRFVLRYAKDSKMVEVTNQVSVYDNTVLTVESGKLNIKNIQVFDLLGKQLLNKNEKKKKNYPLTTLNRTKSILIVKVTLEDNTEEVRKVIY